MDELATTAVIVTFNSGGHIAAAVESCIAQRLAVVVFDNASADDTVARVPVSDLVTVVRSPRNAGFAAGVNAVVRAAKTPLLLLLNPDAVLLNSISPIVRYVSAGPLHAAAGLLVEEDGTPQAGFSVRRLPTAATLALQVIGVHTLFPGNPVNRRYRYHGLDLTQAAEVEQPAGACLLFRRDDWEALGGFDERFYPLWFEDVDFCRRFLEQGGRIRLDPAVRVRHEGAHSIRTLHMAQRQAYWHVSLLRYAAKHFPWSGRVAVASAVFAALVPRALLSLIFDSPGAAIRAFRQIAGQAWRCLWARE